MANFTLEEKREFLAKDLFKLWNRSQDPWGRKLWKAVTAVMVFVGNYEGFSGADKKVEVLKIVEILLKNTDSPGPDFLVDKFILWMVEYGIDYLYDAAKGSFNFDGGD